MGFGIGGWRAGDGFGLFGLGWVDDVVNVRDWGIDEVIDVVDRVRVGAEVEESEVNGFGGGVAPIGIGIEHSIEDGDEGWVEAGDFGGEVLLPLPALVDFVVEAGGIGLTGEEAKGGDGEAVKVAAGSEGFAFALFGGAENGVGADRFEDRGGGGGGDRALGATEVDQDRGAVWGLEDVVGVEVAVDELGRLGVEVGEDGEERLKKLDGLGFAKGAASEVVAVALAFDPGLDENAVFAGETVGAVGELEVAVVGSDLGVVEAVEEGGFAFDGFFGGLEVLGGGLAAAGEDFEEDGAVGFEVFGAEVVTVGGFVDDVEDLVAFFEGSASIHGVIEGRL